MKKILFGIALILFGFYATYVGTISGDGIFELIGLGCSLLGLVFSVIGFFSKSQNTQKLFSVFQKYL